MPCFPRAVRRGLPGALLAAALVAPSAHAAIITVDSLADDHDAGPNGNCTLREAVLAANGDTAVDGCAAGQGADEIRLPAGSYALSIVGEDDTALAGDLDVTGALTVRGTGVSSLIDAGGIDRIFDVPAGASLELAALRLTGGEAGEGDGGAILTRGDLALDAVLLDANHARNGGAVYVGAGGSLVGNDAAFLENSATHGGGLTVARFAEETGTAIAELVGGSFTRNRATAGSGAVAVMARFSATNVLFRENSAGGSAGAVTVTSVYTSHLGEATITDCVFERNRAGGHAGAIYVGAGHFVSTDLDVSGSRFEENVAEAGDGGAIYVGAKTRTRIEDSTFERNESGGNGGALRAGDVELGGGAYVLRSRFVDNRATSGGAVYGFAGGGTFEESTFEANTATDAGGAIAISGYAVAVGAGAGLGLVRSTLVGNDAARGGAVYLLTDSPYEDLFTSVSLTNSTVSGNGSTAGESFLVESLRERSRLTLANVTIADTPEGTQAIVADGGSVVRLTNTLVAGGCALAAISEGGNVESPGDSCGLSQPADQANVTALALALGPLADNGGPTLTHALEGGSVALDAALNDPCPATDQRGLDRIDGACDVGAYEDGAAICTDGDGDGYFAEGEPCGPADCDDADPAVNPGAAEIPTNGIDDDCDPSTPTGCTPALR